MAPNGWARRRYAPPGAGGRWPGGGRPRIIALVGIDGSGKTTQAHRLAAALETAGVRARYWQNAGGRRWLGRLARRLGRGDAQRLLGRRGLMLAESVLRWLAIARALARSLPVGQVAIMDRYAVCQYASIRAHGGGRIGERVARLAYRIFPRPDVTLLLSVDPAEAYRRIELRGTDHETMAFLSAAAAAYAALPERSGFALIDASAAPDEVACEVTARLGLVAARTPTGTLVVSGPAAPAGPPSPVGQRSPAGPPAQGGSRAPDGPEVPAVVWVPAPPTPGSPVPGVEGAPATMTVPGARRARAQPRPASSRS